MTTGEKIALLRTSKGFSQEELADKLDVSRQTVYKWESDAALPKKEYLKQLVELFETTFDYLLDDDHEEVKEVEKEVEETKEEIKEKRAPEVIIVSAPIVEQQQTAVVPLAICQKCKKIITSENDLVRIPGSYNQQGFQAEDTVYCASCNKEVNDRKVIAAAEKKVSEKLMEDAKKKLARRDFWISFVLGIIVMGLIVGIGLAKVIQSGDGNNVLVLIASAILSFFFVSCLFLRNNGAASVLSTIASWSIKFPGLIFTLDLDGILWFILVKIIFGLISIIISILMVILGLVVAAALSVFMYPFALVKNFKDPEDKDNFFEQFMSDD